jgi:hypothetical protein
VDAAACSFIFIKSSCLFYDFFRSFFLLSEAVEGDEMSLALNRSLNAEIARPDMRAPEGQEPILNISVIFTSVSRTISALKRAGALAESLGARVTLVVPQVVPYPLPLTSPPVLLEFQENRFREIAGKSPVHTRVQLYLCRDGFETLRRVLKPGSLVVVGGRRRFWPTQESSLVRKLRKAGHEVIFDETE